MSAPRPHIVRTQALQVAVAANERAQEILVLAAGLARTRLPAETDEIFSRHCDSRRQVRLDRIELNLGTIPFEHFARDFPERYRAALDAELSRLLRLRLPEPAAERAATDGVPRLALLLHVLQHGHLPWWAAPEPDFDPPAEFIALLAQAPAELCAGLRRIGRQRVVRRRLVQWLDDPGIARLVQALAPAEAPFILAYAADLDRRQRQEPFVPAPAAEFRQAKWEIILGHLLADAGSRFNAKAFLRQTLQNLAGRFRIAYAELLGELVRTAEAMAFTWGESSLPNLLGELQAEDLSREPAEDAAETPLRHRLLAQWSARLGWIGGQPPAGPAPPEFWRTLPPAETAAIFRALVARHGAAAVVLLLEGAAPSDRQELREILHSAATGTTEHISDLRELLEEMAEGETAAAADEIAALRALLETGRLPRHGAFVAWQDRTVAWLSLALVRHAVLVAPLLRQWARSAGFVAGVVRRQPEPLLELLLEAAWPRQHRAAVGLIRFTVAVECGGPRPARDSEDLRLRLWQLVLRQALAGTAVPADLARAATAVVGEWSGGPAVPQSGASVLAPDRGGPADPAAGDVGLSRAAPDRKFSGEHATTGVTHGSDGNGASQIVLESGRVGTEAPVDAARAAKAVVSEGSDGPAGPQSEPSALVPEEEFSGEHAATGDENAADEFGTLRIFLETGRVPLHHLSAAAQERVEEWLRAALVRHADQVAPLLRAWARREGFVARVIRRQAASVLEMLIGAGWPQEYRAAHALVRAVAAADIRLRIWRALFARLVSGTGPAAVPRDLEEVWAGALPAEAERGLADFGSGETDRPGGNEGGTGALAQTTATPVEAGAADGAAAEIGSWLAASPLLRRRLLAVLQAGRDVAKEARALLKLYGDGEIHRAAEFSSAGDWELVAPAIADDPTALLQMRTTVWTTAGIGAALRTAASRRLLEEAMFAGEPAQAAWWRDMLEWLEQSPAAAELFRGGRAELRVRLWTVLAQLVREDGGRPVQDASDLLVRALARLDAGHAGGSSREERAADFAARLGAALQTDGSHRARQLAQPLAAVTSRRSGASRSPVQPSSARPRPRPAESRREEAEPIWIDNAGLVLVAPFFPRLFERCGYLEGGEFTGHLASQRAVHLTQYLVTGAAERWREFAAALNKVLCGLEPAAAVVDTVELTPEECAAADGLLEFCARQWPRGAAVSPAGLRSSYLRRPGKLVAGEEDWRLHVEKRGWDVLLPELPWTFPGQPPKWMPRPLRVDWI